LKVSSHSGMEDISFKRKKEKKKKSYISKVQLLLRAKIQMDTVHYVITAQEAIQYSSHKVEIFVLLLTTQ